MSRIVGNSIVIAAQIDSRYEQIKEVAEDEGYHVRKATDGREASLLAREHLPDVVFLDLDVSPVNGIKASRAITDVFCIDTRVILMHEPGKHQAARIGLGSEGADRIIPHPIRPYHVRNAFDDAPATPGFNGEYRATFIDDINGLEHQTPQGSAAIVETADALCAVVLGEHVPQWAVNQGNHLVIGDCGELIESFKIISYEDKPAHPYGIGKQYWFADSPP